MLQLKLIIISLIDIMVIMLLLHKQYNIDNLHNIC